MTSNTTPLSPRASHSHPALCRAIAQHIQNAPHQHITFAEFMNLALYHPEYGYYASHHQRIGARGDYMTSPHLGADFGELLAEQFVEMWHVLGKPHPFHLVEMGAGQGLIARDVLHYLHQVHANCFEALEYLIIEKSDALIQEQKRHIGTLAEAKAQIRWCQWDEIPAQSITGCFFSNELVDAFPVHQLVFEDGVWREIYVTVDGAAEDNSMEDKPSIPRFIEVVHPVSDSRLQTYFDWVGVPIDPARYPNGYRTEVNLAALEWMETVAHRLHRGYVLTVDYGYTASRYYSPARSQGTLQCYHQHAHHSDPYQHIGQQDITAHVDFSALERRGKETGLITLGRLEQGLFLMAMGLGDRIAALSYPSMAQPISVNDALRRREALHTLINPMGLGNFQVLLQAKGLSAEELSTRLRGFDIP